MAKFAENTTVSIEKSIAEARTLVKKAGATEFATFENGTGSMLVFTLDGIRIKQAIVPPKREDYRYSRSGQWRYDDAIDRAVAAEERRRWRVLVFALKAKLTLIAEGDSSVAREFLADAMMANGQTVGDVMIPALAEITRGEAMPLVRREIIALPSGDR